NFQKIKEDIKLLKDTTKPRTKPHVIPPLEKSSLGTTQSRAMKELIEAESDDDDDDDVEDEEDIMINCPDYCRCAGQYAAATTARCSRLIDNQSFGPGIAHLLIENAGEIRLGPHALRDRDLEHIETITIVDTRVSHIDLTAFDGITYLFAVNLSRNGIIDIHPDTFENNTQLNLLTISGNPFWRDWSVTKDYLLNAPSVTEFDFSWNSMPHLPNSAFSKMPTLAYLNLKQNRLSNIDRAIFKPLSSLVELDLSGNLLTDLPSDVFEGTDLQSLKLNDNFLTSLTSVNATSLDILDVSNNRIKVIAKGDLDNVPSLEQLIISGNELKRIHQHAFSELDQLEHLDISNNKLTSFTEHHLRNSPRLEVLLMSDNPDLGSLPVFKINGLEYNTYSVYRFECANCGLVELKSGTFNAMPAIANLNLAGNKLAGLPKDLLSPLSSLRELDLSDNMIAFIPSDMLRGAVSMTKLNLAGNPLMTLQVTPFLQAPELTRLDVSRCMLKRVWTEARQHFKSLRFLSVRGNELERITVEELKATPKLSGLDISQNPLNCDAEFDGAIQWLKSHGVIPTETVRYISNLVASETEQHEPSGESVTSWSDLAKLVCEDELDKPILRPVPQKPPTRDDEPTDEAAAEISKSDLGDMKFIKDVWLELDKNIEYDDYSNDQVSSGYRTWYSTAMWSVLTIGLVTLGVLLIIIQFARYMANRRGRGPVIRPPMILRQGLVDNKNCGLVYKPLQEEIATPQLPKKPSGYSRGPFHYKQIVPESS
ncbi:GSCOCG00001983001-RA-CDS, partial [Cotesia congregata]